MPQLSALLVALCTAALVSSGPAPAAKPPASPQAPAKTLPKPMNLKALPKNTSREEVNRLMFQYVGDLGVKCEFCHQGNDDPGKIDYASDENPTKEIARYMMSMTADINEKYIDPCPTANSPTPSRAAPAIEAQSTPAFSRRPRSSQFGLNKQGPATR